MTQEERELHDPDKIEKRFKAIRVQQPIGDVYIASVDANTIQQITFFDVRRRLQAERDIERYLGIQRPLNSGRVDELKKYVTYVDATFPTSVIVAIENDYGRFDEKTGELVLTNTREGENEPTIPIRKVGRVIDGQHRIAGLEDFKTGPDSKFDVIVSFFIGSDIADQAYVFATVNLEQTKVNKSLAYDLFELARSRSPYKTCHNIAVALDQTEGSPFYQKIKRLGVSTEDREAHETITQATFVHGLVGYLSSDPKSDRDELLRGRKLPIPKQRDLGRQVLRGLFVEGNDKLIGKIYEEYFSAIRDKWERAWEYSGTGIMLSRTNGYRALSSIFGRVYASVASPGQFADRKEFRRMFDRVTVEWDYFNTSNFKPGSSGEADLRRMMLAAMDLG